MNEIEKTIVEYYGKEIIIGEKLFFRSKKNQVTALALKQGGKAWEVLAKCFVWGDALAEEKILRECRERGIFVPAPLFRKGNVLLMEFIKGHPLSALHPREPRFISLLAYWMADFHGAFASGRETLLKGDLRLHNFIFDGLRLWGVDFEESHIGAPEEDLADLGASLLESSPSFTKTSLRRFRRLIREYRRRLPLDLPSLAAMLARTLRVRACYRRDLASGCEEWAKALERGEIEI
jgi:tRNA A-37 threonylcarbamoyl transferase component Bud32